MSNTSIFSSSTTLPFSSSFFISILADSFEINLIHDKEADN